ncbi:MAG: hypothetical protein V1909_06940 [Candidatus Micrarchaeota archaeon]
MRKLFQLLVLFALVILLFGCTKNINGENQGADSRTDGSGHTGTPASEEQVNILVEKSRNLYEIQETDYVAVDSKNENTERGTKIVSNRPDSFDGKSARLVTEEINININDLRSTITSRTWIDSNNGCLKRSLTSTVNGKTSELQQDCPEGEMEFFSLEKDGRVGYEGEETVVVPFGTYPAKRYNLGVVGTYWISDGIPVPLKITKGTITMKLVAYKN